ncbi:hypothetical protein [Priestia aryabhattai]|uniref:hypothetical protein n=1 Tax=Priestia aryabhattai TaxID=412384 RepID=UPI0015F57DA8|nr:hypothetical protein [Priestia aryabhattai]
MIEVIVTNLSVQLDNRIIDHQSYVVEIESWNELIKRLENTEWTFTEEYEKYKGIAPRHTDELANLKYDDYHLSYTQYGGQRTLMYIKDRVILN